MIEISFALELIKQNVRPLPSERVSLLNAAGRTLSADVVSDVDSPPHDKSLMDGFAVRAVDAAISGAKLSIIETVLAGQSPSLPLTAGTATRIMTGAPLPVGGDAVVILESTDFDPNQPSGSVTIYEGVSLGKHIMRKADSMRSGETVLQAGTLIRPHHLGILAEVGAASVSVYQRPTISILATGDELVPATDFPAKAQIRNSNGPLLSSMAARVADKVIDLGIARDHIDDLRSKIQKGLKSDILILTGGVSAGMADLVPRVLADCGVLQVFHKVSIKPGKPVWFGVRQNGDARPPTLVFGLPGNPVSTLVCFEVFVVGACQLLAGASAATRSMSRAVLLEAHSVRGGRPTYWPVSLRSTDDGGVGVRPLPWRGSSDLRCLAEADAFAFFPPRESNYQPGEIVSVLNLPAF